ncbi:hypothetical protein CPB85DRAFT_782203 [Mucidula mucida]|nr:hypothetical protein CPB85DRAFT_782203 [Mucidula mucida]
MSSDESEGRAPSPKRLRRLAGSCDFCRKRKIKCDSSTTTNTRCTNCITNDHLCTHDAPTKKRGVKN